MLPGTALELMGSFVSCIQATSSLEPIALQNVRLPNATNSDENAASCHYAKSHFADRQKSKNVKCPAHGGFFGILLRFARFHCEAFFSLPCWTNAFRPNAFRQCTADRKMWHQKCKQGCHEKFGQVSKSGSSNFHSTMQSNFISNFGAKI